MMNIFHVIKEGMAKAIERGITDHSEQCVFAIDYLYDSIEMDNTLLDDDMSEFDYQELSDELLFEAYDQYSINKKIKLAFQSFKCYRYNYDAILIPIQSYFKTTARLYMLEVLLSDATTAMYKNGHFDEDMGDFWAVIETRPYMRVKHNYILNLVEAGHLNEAKKECQECLELCQNDNLGIRYILATVLCQLKQYQEFLELYEKFLDGKLDMLLPLSVAQYNLNNVKEAEKIIRGIVDNNEYFLPVIFKYQYLTSEEEFDIKHQGHCVLGSVEETFMVFDYNQELVCESIGYYQWLKSNFYPDDQFPKVNIEDLTKVIYQLLMDGFEDSYYINIETSEIIRVAFDKVFDFILSKEKKDYSSPIYLAVSKESIMEEFVKGIADERVKIKFISKLGKLKKKDFETNLEIYHLKTDFEKYVMARSADLAKIWCHYHKIKYDF